MLDALALERCRLQLDAALSANVQLEARVDSLSQQLSTARVQYQQLVAAARSAGFPGNGSGGTASRSRWSPVFPRQLHPQRRCRCQRVQHERDCHDSDDDLWSELDQQGGDEIAAAGKGDSDELRWLRNERPLPHQNRKLRRTSLQDFAAATAEDFKRPIAPPLPPSAAAVGASDARLATTAAAAGSVAVSNGGGGGSGGGIAEWLATPGRRLKRQLKGRRLRASVGAWDLT